LRQIEYTQQGCPDSLDHTKHKHGANLDTLHLPLGGTHRPHGEKIKDLESLMALSPLLRYEWYFYIFEATLMLLNSILWNVWNLVLYLPQQHNIYLAPDGQTEVDRKKSRIPGRSSLGLGIRPCT
jgi:hypothetical protein